MFTVYKVTSPSTKVYIGITSKTLTRRKCQHLSAAVSGSDYTFHRAIRKYGDILNWEVVACVDSFEQAAELEKSLITEFNSFKRGYNMTLGGEGQLGRTFSQSQETREKIAKNNARFWTGKSRSDETKKKLSNAQKGKKRGPISTQHRANLRIAALNRYAEKRVAQ